MLIRYFVLQYALPHLRKTKGNIINDSSLVGLIGQVGSVSYVTTKVVCIVYHNQSALLHFCPNMTSIRQTMKTKVTKKRNLIKSDSYKFAYNGITAG